jgi:hypothetical protein
MSTGMLPAEPLLRHTADGLSVTRSMAVLRAAAPFIRALILASVVTVLIMVGLPAVLAIAAGS